MSRIMLVSPWNYHNEGVSKHDLSQEWHNAPYSLILLGTILRKANHVVKLVDLDRSIIENKGNKRKTLSCLGDCVRNFAPDIIAFSFFSVHYMEVKQAVDVVRKTCKSLRINPLLIAGGIHPTIDNGGTINKLGFDYAFVGSGELAFLELANGVSPERIMGFTNKYQWSVGESIDSLDKLPFMDWSLCDYKFYSYPSYARSRVSPTSSLDILMGTGCVHKCNFCAYGVTSGVKFHSSDYLVSQIEYMHKAFGANGFYFIDSTIGNNKKLLYDFCDKVQRKNLGVEWYANIRADQVNEELLRTMWGSGCRYLLYGFESGSQRVLDLMNKHIDIADNFKAAELHNKMRFPYCASMIIGYPNENEHDLKDTRRFIEITQPPKVGINNYVPLPGSPDYIRMKAAGIIKTDRPEDWRDIGQIDTNLYYADMPRRTFNKLAKEIRRIAYATPMW